MSDVSGSDIRRLRERQEWSQNDLAGILNDLLDRNYSSGTISAWEKGSRNVPVAVGAAVEQLLVESNLAPLGEFPTPSPDADPSRDSPPDHAAAQDTAPGVVIPPGQRAPILSPTGNTYARACAELWEIIAMGIGTIGAAVGNEAMIYDSQVILADKEALGDAWGKLAERNDVLRRWITEAIEGGAWAQVVLVTGSTMAKCWQGHTAIAIQRRQTASQNGGAGFGSADASGHRADASSEA